MFEDGLGAPQDDEPAGEVIPVEKFRCDPVADGRLPDLPRTADDDGPRARQMLAQDLIVIPGLLGHAIPGRHSGEGPFYDGSENGPGTAGTADALPHRRRGPNATHRRTAESPAPEECGSMYVLARGRESNAWPAAVRCHNAARLPRKPNSHTTL